jgi:hypothetical protein
MSVLDSFDQFEEKYGKGNEYTRLDSSQIAELRKSGLPGFYIDYLEENGLREFGEGFWWFVDPLDWHEELAPFAGSANLRPAIRTAFGGFIVLHDDSWHYLDPHTKSFPSLGRQLGILVNMTLTKDYALQNMFYGDYFQAALARLRKVGADEMYAFAPALGLGGTVNAEGVHIVRMREHLAFLAQL